MTIRASWSTAQAVLTPRRRRRAGGLTFTGGWLPFPAGCRTLHPRCDVTRRWRHDLRRHPMLDTRLANSLPREMSCRLLPKRYVKWKYIIWKYRSASASYISYLLYLKVVADDGNYRGFDVTTRWIKNEIGRISNNMNKEVTEISKTVSNKL